MRALLSRGDSRGIVVGAAWIDEIAATDGLAAEEHAKAHLVAARESQLDRVLDSEELDSGLHDEALVLVPCAAAHAPNIEELRLRDDLGLALAL